VVRPVVASPLRPSSGAQWHQDAAKDARDQPPLAGAEIVVLEGSRARTEPYGMAGGGTSDLPR
jgi:hypothetical protein